MNLITKDYNNKYFEKCCELLAVNWDFYSHFDSVKNKSIPYKLYFKRTLIESSYKKIVVNDNDDLMGMIFAEITPRNKLYLTLYNIYVLWYLLIGKLGKRRAAFKFLDKYRRTCKKLYSKASFDGELFLFVVSEKSRGLGIGKTLYKNYLKECKINNINKIGLQTGADCDYKIYDHLGFKRESALYTDMYIKGKEDTNFYIYTLSLNK